MESIDWNELEELSNKIEVEGFGTLNLDEYTKIKNAIAYFYNSENWDGIIRLRETFKSLIIRETAYSYPGILNLNDLAIESAIKLGKKNLQAQFMYDKAKNFHRMGYHTGAIDIFKKSINLFQLCGETFKALDSYYWIGLCHRANGEIVQAKKILNQVLQESVVVPIEDERWRGNPIQVMAWISQQEGNLEDAERLLRQAVLLYEKFCGIESIEVAHATADLALVLGLRKQKEEAYQLFKKSLSIITKFPGQYARQEARVMLKYSEILILNGEFEKAMNFLNRADNTITAYGANLDLLWRIEFARALIFFRTKRFISFYRKMRVIFTVRNTLGINNPIFTIRDFKHRLLI